MQDWISDENGLVHVRPEDIFPELKENEDERIRKRIIALVNAHGQGMYKDEMLAWLEKQKKQRVVNIDANKFRPASYWENENTSRKQDYSTLNDFERAIHRGFLCAGLENVPVTIIKETAKDALDNIIFIKHNDKVVSVSITKSS